LLAEGELLNRDKCDAFSAGKQLRNANGTGKSFGSNLTLSKILLSANRIQLFNNLK
jgi:hypothetical protein